MAIVTTHVAAVQELYVAYFGRPADVAGLDYWTNVVQAQAGSLTAVSAAFAKEKEYTDLFTGMSNAQIVDKIYVNMFGHAADTAGRDYWVGLLNNNTITIDTVVAEVAKGAQGTDNTAIENKVAAATAFTNALDLPAEQAGYTGAAAAVLAKAFIAGVTTDATLAAAIAPTALNATINAVVAAGTPFTLVSGLATLNAANASVADFLDTLDLDDDADTPTSARDVFDALYGTDGTPATATTAAVVGSNGAIFDVDAEIGGSIDFATASPTVRTALIQDRTAALNTQLTAAQDALAEDQADVEEVAGLSAAVAALASADTTLTASNEAEDEALALQNGAIATFNSRVGATLTVGTDGTVTGYIVENEDTGALELATGLTAAQRTAATPLLAAVTAYQEALDEQTAAAEALFAAQLEVNLLDKGTAAETSALALLVAELNPTDVGTISNGMPTAAQILTQRAILTEAGPSTALTEFEDALSGFMAINDASVAANVANNPLANAVIAQTAVVEGLEEDIEDLADAVAALEVAQGNFNELTALNTAVTAASNAFTTNGFRAPVTLDEVTAGVTLAVAATAGADIFVVGDSMSSTISSFGRVGADSLYIGTDYTLNTGAITTGNNQVLEVFFINNSTGGVQVRLETEVYGSDSAAVAEQIITLTGVTADQLQLVDGIISLKAAATA